MLAIAASGNATLLRAADAVAPIGTLWVNAIRMTVIPLVVSLLITGVASAADVTAVGRLGGRTLLVFVLLLVGVAIVDDAAGAVAVRAAAATARARRCRRRRGGGASRWRGGQGQTFGDVAQSLIPRNPIAAAANGAMVPLSCSRCCWRSRSRAAPARRARRSSAFFRALGEAMLTLVRWVICWRRSASSRSCCRSRRTPARAGRRDRLLHSRVFGG